MKKPIILVILAVSILVIVIGFALYKYTKITKESRPKVTEYKTIEKFVPEVCGDITCSAGEICNKVTHKCQEKAALTESTAKQVANNYLASKNITGSIERVRDTYYKAQAVKEVYIDCTEGEHDCGIILLLDENGKILEEARSD